MGRSWVSAPGASLTFSVLLRPVSVPAARRGWLPLLTGVSVACAVRDVSGVAAVLKWPNDVLVGSRKLAGILAEQSGDAVVIGIGLNVATPADALPVSPGGLPATSLLVEGASVSREALLAAILRELERRYAAFRDDPDPARAGLLSEYRALCATLGRSVRVELPGGRVLSGVAEDIDADGRLLVADGRAVRRRRRSRPAMSSTSGRYGTSVRRSGVPVLGTAGSSPLGGFEIAEVIMWLVLQRPVGQSRISSAAGLAGDDPLWRHLLYVREGGGGHRRSSAYRTRTSAP